MLLSGNDSKVGLAKKQIKPSDRDPQPLRALDGSCICDCRFTLAELKGSCPKRKKGLLKNLQVEAKEHGLNSDSKASEGQLLNMVRALQEKPPDELSFVNDSSRTVY